MNEKRDHTIDILQDALKTAYSVPPIAPCLTTLMITSLVRVTHSRGLIIAKTFPIGHDQKTLSSSDNQRPIF